MTHIYSSPTSRRRRWRLQTRWCSPQSSATRRSGCGSRLRRPAATSRRSPRTPPCCARPSVAIGDTGVPVFDVEIARLGVDFRVLSTSLSFLDTAGRLKARAVLVAGDDPDEAAPDGVASRGFYRARGRLYGLAADLEFAPWTSGEERQGCRPAHREPTPAGIERPRAGRMRCTPHARQQRSATSQKPGPGTSSAMRSSATRRPAFRRPMRN